MGEILEDATNFIKGNLTAIGAGVGGAALGAGVTLLATHKKSSTRRRRRKSHKNKSVRSRSRRSSRRRRTPHTAGKRRDRSTKRIRYTKRGQPYVIMASGKARFISSRSASSSRKRKGGKY